MATVNTDWLAQYNHGLDIRDTREARYKEYIQACTESCSAFGNMG